MSSSFEPQTRGQRILLGDQAPAPDQGRGLEKRRGRNALDMAGARWGPPPVRTKVKQTCITRRHIRAEPSGTATSTVQVGHSRSDLRAQAPKAAFMACHRQLSLAKPEHSRRLPPGHNLIHRKPVSAADVARRMIHIKVVAIGLREPLLLLLCKYLRCR
jgi:hypothetical protein